MSIIRKIRRFYVGYKFFIFAAGILALGLIYFFLFSSVFRIKDVQFSGSQLNDTVKNTMISAIKNSNIFLFSQSNYREEIKSQFPEVRDFFVKKDYIKRNILIMADNRREEGIWCMNDVKCFYFDNSGVIFREAPRIISGSVFILVNEYSSSTDEIILPKNIFSDAVLSFIHMVSAALKDFSLAGRFLINDSSHEIVFETTDNFKITFSAFKASEYKANIFRALLESLRDKFNILEYIDLRVVDRVFYKVKQ